MKFEDQINNLQTIVEELESGEKSLDESIELFNQGIDISKKCMKVLNNSKGKISQLKEEMGKIIEEDYEV